VAVGLSRDPLLRLCFVSIQGRTLKRIRLFSADCHFRSSSTPAVHRGDTQTIRLPSRSFVNSAVQLRAFVTSRRYLKYIVHSSSLEHLVAIRINESQSALASWSHLRDRYRCNHRADDPRYPRHHPMEMSD
jgi:hypothetical protein